MLERPLHVFVNRLRELQVELLTLASEAEDIYELIREMNVRASSRGTKLSELLDRDPPARAIAQQCGDRPIGVG
jgi:hypothetical protein